MKRKDIILILSKYFGRYPTVVEINYFEKTGQVKKVEHFSQEEHIVYNPSQYELKKAFDSISHMLYIWYYVDKIKAKLERERIKEARDKRIEARDKEMYKRWEASKIKSLMQSKAYVSNRGTPASERALKKQIVADNKRRVRNILKFHEINDVAIPEEMWGVIVKYK